MKAYIVVCTIFFAFIALAHGLELAESGGWRLREPDFVITSLATIAILGWSIVLLIRPRGK